MEPVCRPEILHEPPPDRRRFIFIIGTSMPFRLVCSNCGWHPEPGVAMKPDCPECQSKMKLITGSLDEIEAETERIRNAAKN